VTGASESTGIGKGAFATIAYGGGYALGSGARGGGGGGIARTRSVLFATVLFATVLFATWIARNPRVSVQTWVVDSS
jgi:hypothetical protein